MFFYECLTKRPMPILPSFDINLHFLFNNESSTDKQVNIVIHSTTISCERVLNIFIRQLLRANSRECIWDLLSWQASKPY